MKRFVYLLCSILFSMACLHVIADESRSMRLMSNGEVKASYIVSDIDSIKFVKTTLSQLSYDANGGTGEMKTQFFEEDIQANLYENTFVRENYTFVGWSTKPNGEGDFYADKEKCSFNEDVTLYAQWEQIVYTITFDANGGEGSMNPQEMKAGEEQAMSENAYTREYYQFVGWNTRVHGDGISYNDKQMLSLTQDMTLYAQWERMIYAVTFDANGGQGTMEAQSIGAGQEKLLSANVFTRENYVFQGWNTSANGSGTKYDNRQDVLLTENITLYAQWEQIVYTITFDANGGEGSMNPQEMKAGEEQAMSENAYTREYYQFVGWNTRVHGDGTAYTNAQVTSLTDNMTLYAQWERIMYTIKYDANGGEGIMDEQSIAAGQEKLLSQNVYTRKNYVFNGWNTAADGSGIAYENRQDVTLQGNLTLYAQWIQSVYTITFDANGGEGTMDNQIIVAGEKPSIDSMAFTREYYAFIGWNTAADGSGTSYEDSQIIDMVENLILYAQWQRKSYSVTFDSNGGEGTMAVQSFSAGVEQSLSTNNYKRDDHRFVSWNTAADGSGTSYTDAQSLALTQDITLYAQWEVFWDEAEQVFIGVVAFNKIVNQIPITSNLDKAKNFISEQTNEYDFTAFAYGVSKGNLMFDADNLPDFDKIFMLNFSDGTDNYSNMLWGEENRMVPVAYVYDTVQYDLSQRKGLNVYALSFGDDVGFGAKLKKVVMGSGGYYNAKTSEDLQSTFNTIAESIIASAQNVIMQTNPGYYSDIMGYKYFRFTFEAENGIRDTIDARMEGMPNTGYTLSVVRSANNYAQFDYPATGTIDETTGKVNIPLSNLKFVYEGEELQFEYEIWFSPDNELYYEDVEEASTSEDISKRIAVVMVLDCSTSMGNAFEPMKEAASDFIDILEGMISTSVNPDSIRITFDANGGTGEMSQIEVLKGESIVLPANSFTRYGYAFTGWNTKADGSGTGYENKSTITLKRSQTLYAQWNYDPTNGHEYVDLGLPSGLKWATCNVGAYAPENYGTYYAWGETQPKSQYIWMSYKHCNGSSSKLTKYNTGSSWGTVDNKNTLEMEDDAARVNWGGAWRMPTYNEWDELKNNCTWTWTTQNGVKGYKVTSKTNGNSIFLPATGYRDNTSGYDVGYYGNYWSSSLLESTPNNAYNLYFRSGGDVDWYSDYRYYGHTVRAVFSEVEESKEIVIKFNANGGVGTMPSQKMKVGDFIKLTNTFVRDGYICVGWNTQADGSGTSYENNQIVDFVNFDTDVTLYAQWNYDHTNGHEYVDLGLPSGLKWATCNIGATTPEAYGDYFAWGEIEPKNNYDWSTYKYCNGSYDTMTKYCTKSGYGYNGFTDGKPTLELSDDAARVNWGGKWRMPTYNEWNELKNSCTWKWTTQNGVNGYKVTSKTNGNSIFLPAAGDRDGTSVGSVGSYGRYWSSSLYESNPYSAYSLYFDSGDVRWNGNDRYGGHTVRAVCP